MAQEPQVVVNKDFIKRHKTVVMIGCVVICFVICLAAISARNAQSVYLPSDHEEEIATPQVQDNEDDTEPSIQEVEKDHIWIHVSGAVIREGLYELDDDSRINDAIEAAGGLVDDADLSDINLAQKLADGQKVYVPHVGETPPANTQSSIGSSPASGTANGLVNINTASQIELETLSGVGPSTADAIIKDRETNGPFASPEDIMRVNGIGPKKYEKIKDEICI